MYQDVNKETIARSWTHELNDKRVETNHKYESILNTKDKIYDNERRVKVYHVFWIFLVLFEHLVLFLILELYFYRPTSVSILKKGNYVCFSLQIFLSFSNCCRWYLLFPMLEHGFLFFIFISLPPVSFFTY